MSKPVQKLITSRKMPLPPEQQRNPGAGAKAVQPQQPNAQKAHVGGKANKKGKMGITGLDKDAPEEDDDGESLDKLGTLHVHQGYDASTRKLLRGRVLQKQPTTYNQTGCIHASTSEPAPLQVDVLLRTMDAVIDVMDPITMPPGKIADLLGKCQLWLRSRVFRGDLLDKGFFDKLMPYAKDQASQNAVVDTLYKIIAAPKRTSPEVVEFLDSGLNMPHYLTEILDVKIVNEASYHLVYKTVAILSRLTKWNSGRVEVRHADCLQKCMALLTKSTPADVILEAMTIVFRCLDTKVVTVNELLPHLNDRPSETDVVDVMVDHFIYSDYRSLQKMAWKILAHFVSNSHIRNHLLYIDYLPRLFYYLDRTKLEDIHPYAFAFYVILWLNKDALLTCCCNGFELLLKAFQYLEQHMLDSEVMSKVMLRVFEHFTFYKEKLPDAIGTKPSKGMRRKAPRGKSVSASCTTITENMIAGPKNKPYLVYNEANMLLLHHLELDLLPLRLLRHSLKAGDDLLARHTLQLLLMWWKEDPEVRDRHLRAENYEHLHLLVNLMTVAGMAGRHRKRHGPYYLRRTSLLAFKAIVWLAQESPLLRKALADSPGLPQFIFFGLHQYVKCPRHTKYSCMLLCWLVSESRKFVEDLIRCLVLETCGGLIVSCSDKTSKLGIQWPLIVIGAFLGADERRVLTELINRNVAECLLTCIPNIPSRFTGKPRHLDIYQPIWLAFSRYPDTARFAFQFGLVQYINSVIRNEVVTARTGTLLRPRAKNGTRYVFYEGLRWVRQNIYLNCPSAKFAVYGQLEEGDSSLDDFYMREVPGLLDVNARFRLESLCLGEGSHSRLLCIHHTDGSWGTTIDVAASALGVLRFIEMVTLARHAYSNMDHKSPDVVKDLAITLARIVCSAMGGIISDEKLTYAEYLDEYRKFGLGSTTIVPVSAIHRGFFRHRALLFKGLCDFFSIPCTLETRECGHRAWNVVCIAPTALTFLKPKFRTTFEDRMLSDCKAGEILGGDVATYSLSTSAPFREQVDESNLTEHVSGEENPTRRAISPKRMSFLQSWFQEYTEELSSKGVQAGARSIPPRNQGKQVLPGNDKEADNSPPSGHDYPHLLRSKGYRPDPTRFTVDLAYNPGLLTRGTVEEMRYTGQI